MRIFIGTRNDKNVEHNDRLSKCNYGSRTHYSIQNTILEKRLTHDAAIRSMGPMMHNASDLEACYNCQLPNIGYLVQESVRVCREVSKLFASVLPVTIKNACAGHGIGQKTHGGRNGVYLEED